jgi:hypothetical protein
MYDPNSAVREEERKYQEPPMRGDPVTREEHMRDIARLDISDREKAERFADEMPINAILD